MISLQAVSAPCAAFSSRVVTGESYCISTLPRRRSAPGLGSLLCNERSRFPRGLAGHRFHDVEATCSATLRRPCGAGMIDLVVVGKVGPGARFMEFRLFGEVRLQADGQVLDIGAPRQQAVLAALAVDAGRPVPIETLIDRLWSDAPPVEARNVVYSHLSRLRQVLSRASRLTGAVARIDRRHAGYVLDVDPDLVDLHRFARLVEQGRDPGGLDEDRAAALTEALDLWRGPPLAGVTGTWADEVRSSWHRRRLDAVVQWAELQLRLDRAAAVTSTLPDLTAEYPLAEPLEGLLMRALHAAGRDAEAIERYAALRQRLADELGTDPAPELRALHVAILKGELPSPERGSPPDRRSRVAAPAQLPPDVPGFAGRDEELQHLDGVLGAGSRAARAVVVSGTAGVGKT